MRTTSTTATANFPRTALALALWLALPAAQAQWVNQQGLDIQVLRQVPASNLDGSTQRAYPMTPPVAVQQANGQWMLQGSTMYGAGQIDSGRSDGGLTYRIDLDAAGTSTAYQQWAMPQGLSWLNTDLTALGNGRFLATTLTPGQMIDGKFVVNQYAAALENGQVSLAPPTNAGTFTGPETGTGHFARDPDGNIYFGDSIQSGDYIVGITYRYPLMRRKPDGTREQVVDFADFLDTANQAYVKGGTPTQLFWSTLDDMLYIGSLVTVATSASTYPGVPAGETITSVLSRIPGAALRRGNVTADDIEVLHYFRKSSEGTIARNSTERLYGLVEDGDWLYGNGQLGDYDGIWRLNRKAASPKVDVLKFVPQLDAVHGTDGTPPNLAGGLAGESMGLIARALDGNIYGTVMKDASLTSANRRGVIGAQGKGAIFRLVPGTEPDRSDDRIEIVRYLNDGTMGHTPFGLRAGPVIAGKQWLLGVTKDGDIATGCTTDCSAGAVYALTIDLPAIAFTQALAADKASYKVGERPILSWATTGAQQCEAGGGWQGSQQASDRIQLPALTAAGTVQYILTCQGHTGSQATETRITVTEDSGTVRPTPPVEEQDVGGGGAMLPAGAATLALLAMLRRRNRTQQ